MKKGTVVEVILGMHITKADTYNFLKRKGKFCLFCEGPLGENYHDTSLFKSRKVSQRQTLLILLAARMMKN